MRGKEIRGVLSDTSNHEGHEEPEEKMSANSRVKGVMVPFKNFVFFMVRSCCLDTLATAPTFERRFPLLGEEKPLLDAVHVLMEGLAGIIEKLAHGTD